MGPVPHTVRGAIDGRDVRRIEHLRRFYRVPEAILVGALIKRGLDSDGELDLPPRPNDDPDDVVA
jgi:hypothetical protein